MEHKRSELLGSASKATTKPAPAKGGSGSQKAVLVKIGVAVLLIGVAGVLLVRHYTSTGPEAPPEVVSEAQVVAERLAEKQPPPPPDADTVHPDPGSGRRMVPAGQ